MPALLLRLLPYLAAGLALFAAVAWYGHKCDQSGYRRAQAEMAAAVRKAEEATRQAEIESRERVEAVDRDYQIQLESLDAKYRDASDRLGRISVRRCPAGGVTLSGTAEPAAVDHDPASADGLPRDAGGTDIGPALIELMMQADKQTQQLLACQSFVRALSVQ